MLSRTFLDFFFQYYHKAHKNIAYSIENSLPQLAAKFIPQKGANLKSKKAHCAVLHQWLVYLVLLGLLNNVACIFRFPWSWV